MKKIIIASLVVLFCSVSMSLKAATITLMIGEAPGYSTASIDASNNITLTSSSGYITQIIYFSNVPYPRYWYESVPNLGWYTFSSQSAYTIVVQWWNYETSQVMGTTYNITY